jgi:hypothetical protein
VRGRPLRGLPVGVALRATGHLARRYRLRFATPTAERPPVASPPASPSAPRRRCAPPTARASTLLNTPAKVRFGRGSDRREAIPGGPVRTWLHNAWPHHASRGRTLGQARALRGGGLRRSGGGRGGASLRSVPPCPPAVRLASVPPLRSSPGRRSVIAHARVLQACPTRARFSPFARAVGTPRPLGRGIMPEAGRRGIASERAKRAAIQQGLRQEPARSCPLYVPDLPARYGTRPSPAVGIRDQVTSHATCESSPPQRISVPSSDRATRRFSCRQRSRCAPDPGPAYELPFRPSSERACTQARPSLWHSRRWVAGHPASGVARVHRRRSCRARRSGEGGACQGTCVADSLSPHLVA